ncbi:Homoserine kinase [uncultured Alphaproteobacteria bacterium]|uniref:Homoserine kinase n=1 Tax=uncultured Alphaproteobacteria bacterium TaxID=91750 RepID=A0A212KLV2_9PROT|nr:Homoserine kinase [uncultured Alphaproteobacteria bacterium]
MAVYTDVSDADLEGFAAAYDIADVVSFKGIAEGVENSNFLVQTDDGASYILTLYEKRVNPADLPWFLGLMRHLAGRGVTCPLPIAAKDGEALRTLAGRPAALFSFLKGLSPRHIGVAHCAGVGAALARLHLAGADYPATRRNALSVDGWRPLFELARDRADEVMPGLAAEIATDLDDLERLWPADLPKGVIHADLFPDNVFFRGEAVSGVIDFYFACADLYAYDLVIAMNAWCFEPDRAFNVTKARRLLDSYAAIRPLSAAETAALPLLARGAAVRFLLTRLYDWLNTPPGALVRPKDPLEYLRIARFHRGLAGPGAYGVDA